MGLVPVSGCTLIKCAFKVLRLALARIVVRSGVMVRCD